MAIPGSILTVPSISVIVPTFNEAPNLPLLVQGLASVLTRVGLWEVIIVDDDSHDGSREVLNDLALRYPQLTYKIRVGERGLSSAVLAGMALAHNEYVVVMDADLSHPADAIPAMIEKLQRDEADFVIGSRYCDGGCTEDWSRLRWLNSAGATLLAKPLVGSIKDPMAGFFAMRRDSLRYADPLNPIGYKIALELLVKTHIPPNRVAEVPITFRNRIHGESKLTMREQFRYLEHLSRLYDYAFPKASPRAKFLIAAGCGVAACFSTLALMNRLDLAPILSIAGGLLAMIAVAAVFFLRYVNTQREFIVMKHPYWEFLYISMAEFITGWAFAICTQAHLSVQMAAGVTVVLLVRYTLRKVFLHDLRGIRGTPRPGASVRIALATGPISPKPAASA
ncbi:MAG TPA: polyprenol monophosphomannose synthase [Phycisphaerae bacterium]|nr:polyprenol monophosphomannose synthase [Phycisphaerae bacterium]